MGAVGVGGGQHDTVLHPLDLQRNHSLSYGSSAASGAVSRVVGAAAGGQQTSLTLHLQQHSAAGCGGEGSSRPTLIQAQHVPVMHLQQHRQQQLYSGVTVGTHPQQQPLSASGSARAAAISPVASGGGGNTAEEDDDVATRTLLLTAVQLTTSLPAHMQGPAVLQLRNIPPFFDALELLAGGPMGAAAGAAQDGATHEAAVALAMHNADVLQKSIR